MSSSDTIAAIATPPGEGGIGIIRLSGNFAIDIAEKIFRSTSKIPVSKLKSHTLNHGKVIDPETGEKIDEILLGIMRSPKSYTGEEVVEFNCHGGMAILRSLLDLTLRSGARIAEPGEFTKRAFLNGRLDLVQAEAVMELIGAKTELTRKIAISQLSGNLSKSIDSLNDRTANLLAEVEAQIDFPDEDLFPDYFMENVKTLKIAEEIAEGLDRLIETASEGRILSEGVNVVILGKPNVGKSSLLNALLKIDRAIVTAHPGTTRDTIEEPLNFGGIPIKLIDTAGIRETDNVIEKIGIERSKNQINSADLLLLMLAVDEPLDEAVRELLEVAKEKRTVIILNKIDLPPVLVRSEVASQVPRRKIVEMSLLEETGIDQLKSAIMSEITGGKLFSTASVIVTNARHHEALRLARIDLRNAIESLKQNQSIEFVALDLRSGLDRLGEIVGKTTTDELLGRIFSQFCIGK